MNRTIKDATVKRFHYENLDQLRTHLADFLAANNFARRLKTLSGLTPYEYICKICTSEPDRFILDPIHQMPGLNSRLVFLFLRPAGPRTLEKTRCIIADDAAPLVSCRTKSRLSAPHATGRSKRAKPRQHQPACCRQWHG